ncbi:MAG TPA: transcriptional repressor LexA [Candidatus Sulfotelmatobacter sp.]|jgi:repressor LexA|nr:transcriptional repressor LexA [Candidatus Sulfotelmatobacter sp.]
MALTKRQREVFDIIREFIAANGYSPSLEEIGATLGLSSVATVHKHVTHLVEKGLVRRVWNQNRSIELVDSAAGRALDLPLVGTIAAGTPLEAVPTTETITVPADMVSGRGRTFVLKIHGDSMTGEHIREGDYVVIEERQTARDGETIVALVDGADATLKRFYRDGATVRLQPSHPTMPPIVLAADRVQVQGVVVGLIRKY